MIFQVREGVSRALEGSQDSVWGEVRTPGRLGSRQCRSVSEEGRVGLLL